MCVSEKHTSMNTHTHRHTHTQRERERERERDGVTDFPLSLSQTGFLSSSLRSSFSSSIILLLSACFFSHCKQNNKQNIISHNKQTNKQTNTIYIYIYIYIYIHTHTHTYTYIYETEFAKCHNDVTRHVFLKTLNPNRISLK